MFHIFCKWKKLDITEGMQKRGVTHWRVCTICGKKQIKKPWYKKYETTFFDLTCVQQPLSSLPKGSRKFECHNCGNDSHCHLIVEQHEENINEMITCKWHSNFKQK